VSIVNNTYTQLGEKRDLFEKPTGKAASRRVKFSRYHEQKYRTELLNRDKIREKVLHDINLPQYDRKEEVPTKSFENEEHSRLVRIKDSGAAEKQLRQNMTPFELELEQEVARSPLDEKTKRPRLKEFLE
jgi:hypothetical protein